MRPSSFGPVMLLLVAAPALADIAPPPPQPPPYGPRTAVIRGVTVEQVFTYWRGRRWLAIISNCGSGQAACNGRNLAGCIVIGINGLVIDDGNITALIDSDNAAGNAQLKLKLDHCDLKEIELGR
jgi:hypothetical protein